MVETTKSFFIKPLLYRSIRHDRSVILDAVVWLDAFRLPLCRVGLNIEPTQFPMAAGAHRCHFRSDAFYDVCYPLLTTNRNLLLSAFIHGRTSSPGPSHGQKRNDQTCSRMCNKLIKLHWSEQTTISPPPMTMLTMRRRLIVLPMLMMQIPLLPCSEPAWGLVADEALPTGTTFQIYRFCSHGIGFQLQGIDKMVGTGNIFVRQKIFDTRNFSKFTSKFIKGWLLVDQLGSSTSPNLSVFGLDWLSLGEDEVRPPY